MIQTVPLTEDATSTNPVLQAIRYQLRFAKSEDLVWIGHQDLMKVLERLIRRADIPVAHSQGFNPRPKMNFVQALGLGIEAHQEVLEIELMEKLEGSDLLDRLNKFAPRGLFFHSVGLPATRRSALAKTLIYLFNQKLDNDLRLATSQRMEVFLNATEHFVERIRGGKSVTLNLRPLVNSIGWTTDGLIQMSLNVTPQATARPEEVLDAIGLKHLYSTGTLIRHDLILEDIVLSSPASTLGSIKKPDLPA